MWIFLVVIAFLAYAFASIFEKNGSAIQEDHTSIKMIIWFGFFWGLTSLGILVLDLRETSTSVIQFVADTPTLLAAPGFYALSLAFYFLAFKLTPLCIASPIFVTEEIFEFIGTILMFVFLGRIDELEESLSGIKLVLIVAIFLLTIILTIVRNRNEDQEKSKALARGRFLIKNGHFAIIGISAAILYALCDASSSLFDIFFLGELGDEAVIGSMDYLYFDGVFYFFISVVLYFVLWFLDKKPYNPFKASERSRILGTGLESLGTTVWMLAIIQNQIYTNVIVNTYCIMTMILSRVLLKERFGRKETFLIIAITISVLAFLVIEELF